MRKARRSRIRPYPAGYSRTIDPVDKLGLQKTLGAGELEAYYLRGKVSYQTAKLPSEVRRSGRLGESRIAIRPISRNQVEYEFGSLEPLDSIIKPQEEILADITRGLGLERAEEAFGVSIKARLVLHEVNKLPKELQNHRAVQGANDLYHYQTAVGDFTGVVSRSLKLPRGYLRSIPRLIRNELVASNVVKARDPVLAKIRSTLRTEWIISEAEGWSAFLPIMHPKSQLNIHAELTKPYRWQDVGHPTEVVVDGGLITPLNAQIYKLLKRKHFVVLQLPERIM